MKERYFWIALGLISLSFIANTLYANSKQLNEPIFLDHYIETAMDDHNYITFYYLANKNDRSQVRYVRLGGLWGYPQHDFFYDDTAINNIDTYKHHALRSVTVQLQNHDADLKTDLKLNDMIVYFTDDTQITASIGEVIIHPERYPILDKSDALQQRSGGSSSDGSSWDSFQASEPLTIEEISFPFDEPIVDQFTFSIRGKQGHTSLDALDLPIQLNKDGHLTFEIQLRDMNFVNPFEFAIRISGTTDQGKPFTNFVMYHSYPYLTQVDVNRIIQEKTRRDSGE